jgi:uncharacterized membrane protein
MRRSLLSTVLSLSILFSTFVAAQDASYTFTTLDVPGATVTLAYGINDRGQIVGEFSDDGENPGFLTDGATYTTLDAPGAQATLAYGINNRGQIVGWFQVGAMHGFLAIPTNRGK